MAIDILRHLQQTAATAIDGECVIDALHLLTHGRTPRGHERPTADRLAAWAQQRWPAISWRVEPLSPTAANLTATSARVEGRDGDGGPVPGEAGELLFCSHLDTSLSGDPWRDRWVTGNGAPLRRFEVDRAAGLVTGFGLGAARGPAAAALVGFAAAAQTLDEAGVRHRLSLLLAASGTHRSPFAADDDCTGPDGAGTIGAEAYLRAHGLPAAAVVARGGPAGVLYEEPGALFVRVSLHSGFLPVPSRHLAAPPGGLLGGLGTVIAALERWRDEHLAVRPAVGQIAAEVGLGAVRGGLAARPDLLPGLAELHLYVVTLPSDDPGEIVAAITDRLTHDLAGTPLADCRLSVDVRLAHQAGRTPADADVVRHAVAAWEREHLAEAPVISGWKGSTDGVVLRGHGVPTARLGPEARPDPADPRRDVFDLSALLAYARVYADIALRHAVAPATAP